MRKEKNERKIISKRILSVILCMAVFVAGLVLVMSKTARAEENTKAVSSFVHPGLLHTQQSIDAAISNYWANWDLCNIASMLAIGIFCDREDIYNEALSYYVNGEGMGSLFNAMPYVYGENLVQWQEAGRDQGHVTLGIGLCGAINEMAWSQGDDLYGMSDNRFLKAAEYVAKYNNTADEDSENVPYSSYTRYNSANHKYETYEGYQRQEDHQAARYLRQYIIIM